MNSSLSTLQNLPFVCRHTCTIRLAPLPQWHIVMGRARWLVTPHPSDEGAFTTAPANGPWLGPVKALLWIAIAIGTGLLIANLSG